MNLVKLLFLPFVMVAGPQIIIAIFLATTANWRQNSAAFATGAGGSVTPVATIGFLLGTGASNHGASNKTLDVISLCSSRARRCIGPLERARHQGPREARGVHG